MELWVRSQDKMKLIRAIDLGIFEEQEGYTIYYDDSIDNMLGTYKSKERALEVLDEIQNFMLCNKEYKYTTIASINELGGCYIYQMPEE